MTPEEAVDKVRAGGANPFLVLGVHTECTDAQVHRAHRELVRLLHPDRNPSPAAASACGRVNAAYSQLNHAAGRRAAARLWGRETNNATCAICKGTGMVEVQKGFRRVGSLCPTCKGTGVY